MGGTKLFVGCHPQKINGGKQKMKTVNFYCDESFLRKFDAAWKKLKYRTRTEVFHVKMREIIKEAEQNKSFVEWGNEDE